jgi:hypothetical protein
MTPAPLEISLEIIRKGWHPVPVGFKAKKPIVKGWTGLRIDAKSAPQYFNGRPQNVGVLLGIDGLIDVDVDCLEALALADDYLPPTSAMFGRVSKPKSHRLFKVTNPQESKRHEFGNREPIVEYRSTGAQTVYPGSTHESGEVIRWDSEGEPAEVDGVELAEAVARLADAARVKRGVTVGKSVTPSTTVSQLVYERPFVAGDAMERCRRYLATLPDAVTKQGGHKATLTAACYCFRFGVNDAQALGLMTEFNATKCKPVWTDAEIHHKIADARKKVDAAGEFGVMLKRNEVSQLANVTPMRAKVKPWHNTLPRWIREIKLRPFQRVILQALADKCDRKPIDEAGSLGGAIAGFEKLAGECGMTGRTCKRHVKRLCGMGLLVRTSKGGIRFDTGEVMANVYAIPGKLGALDGVTTGHSVPSEPIGLHDDSVTLCHTVRAAEVTT